MSTNRPWDRPWSMDEIIENSDNWNLAGDVALLNTLKTFADNLLTKSTEINNNLENLTKKLDETSLQLNISQNQFQGLRNTQFIESRVYEDDESLPTQKNKENPEEKKQTSLSEEVRLAALKGLEVLDKYFEKVEVEVSDSEDDDIDLPFVLRPKDLYIDRPLPYVIGSEEWHKNWHVGLEDSSSDSETEKVPDNLSESDSESQIIQDRSQIKETSETSSELDFSKTDNKVNFNSSDSENSVAAHNPGRSFAEELSKKLGKVITENYEEPEVNKRPIQPVKSNYVGDIFFDEPPPLDEPKGLFSGGGGLFDDEEEENEDNRIIEEPPKPSKGNFFEEENIFAKEEPSEDIEENKKPIGGVSIFGGANLFDKKLLKRQKSSSSEEEVKEETKKVDLFGNDDLFTKNEKSVKKPSLFDSDNDEDIGKKKIFSADKVTKVKKINLFDSDEEKEDEKDSLFVDVKNKVDGDKEKKIFSEDKETKVKKINLFESDEEKDLFDNRMKNKETRSVEKEETNNSFGSTVKSEEKISLFDDDDLFKDDLFSTKSEKKFTSGLFDDLPEDDLFATNFEEKSKPPSNLFEDVLSIADDKNSINGDTKEETSKKNEESDIFSSSVPKKEESEEAKTHSGDSFTVPSEETKKKSKEDIFAACTSEETKNATNEDIFSDSSEVKKDSKDIFTAFSEENKKVNEDIFTVSSEETKEDIFSLSFDAPKPKPRLNLFDSSPSSPENEDIFFSKKPEVVPREKSLTIPNVPIFDTNPPPDDDDWDTKSDNLSENEDLGNDFEEISSGKATLFSEEPPSLESKSKPGKLKYNLNINVGALMPGATPPRRDVSIPKPDVTDDVPTTKTVSFDETDNVEVLHSVTKDRAKRPLNRRPSTRRGRKEALKNSDSDFNLESDKNVTEGSPSKKVEIDDVFSQKVSTSDIKVSKSHSLFDDEDDADLFTSKKLPTQQTKIVKKSLFDDENDDDDDDIFKSFASTSAKKVNTKVATEKKITKISAVKKLENTKPDDDPLSALLK